MTQNKLIWGLILAIGVPLLSIILGEINESFQRRHHPLTGFLKNLRSWVLPSVAILQLMQEILGFPASDPWLRGVKTIVWLSILYTALSFLPVLLTTGKKPQFWQIYVPNLLFQFTRTLLILAIATFVLGNVWQIDLNQIAAALGVGSLVIALALQDTLSNLVSGFLLIFESPFKVGDWIQVGSIEGEVIEINWRAVRLKTIDRDIVIIPNGNLGKEVICNYTLLDPLHAVRMMMRFSYFDPPTQVKQILKETALSVDGIAAQPEPDIQPKVYGNTFIDYEIVYFIQDYGRIEDIEGDFLSRVYYAAKRGNLTQPFPDKMEYRMNTIPSDPVLTVAEVVEFCRSIPVFMTLSSEVIEQIIQRFEVRYFGMGERVSQAGTFEQNLAIILEGSVQLTALDHHQQWQPVTSLTKGDLLGERVLLAGEPSLVTVTVLEDLKLLLIPPQAILTLLSRYSKFAFDINQLIEERKRLVQIAVGATEFYDVSESDNGQGQHPFIQNLLNRSDV